MMTKMLHNPLLNGLMAKNSKATRLKFNWPNTKANGKVAEEVVVAAAAEEEAVEAVAAAVVAAVDSVVEVAGTETEIVVVEMTAVVPTGEEVETVVAAVVQVLAVVTGRKYFWCFIKMAFGKLMLSNVLIFVLCKQVSK